MIYDLYELKGKPSWIYSGQHDTTARRDAESKRFDLEDKLRLHETYEGYPPDLPEDLQPEAEIFLDERMIVEPIASVYSFLAGEDIKVGDPIRMGCIGYVVAKPGSMVIGYATMNAQKGEYFTAKMT